MAARRTQQSAGLRKNRGLWTVYFVSVQTYNPYKIGYLGIPSLKNKVYKYFWGNPRTLTTSPRTPTTDRVHEVELPTDRSTDYPYGPLEGPAAK